jgi:hypothetical protein
MCTTGVRGDGWVDSGWRKLPPREKKKEEMDERWKKVSTR